MNGYIKIDRSILYHPALQKRGQEFCEKGAFIWLLLEASFVDREYRIKDIKIFLRRGQLCCSHTFMAEAWGWDKSRVQRFLDKLKKFSTITTDAPTNAPSDAPDILTICHYDKYQDTPNDAPTDNKNNKRNNKGNNNIDDIAFEDWWKAFKFIGRNKGSKPRVKSFYKKNVNNKELLKKVLDTYNHYSDHQKSKKLSTPMINTWINNENWDHYNMEEEKINFTPKVDDYKKWVPWVQKGMRSTSIDQTMVQKMLDENLITKEQYKDYV